VDYSKGLATCSATSGNIVVIDMEKLPLGGGTNLSKYIIGKVYVPTKWGGTLTVSGASLSLYYTDGSDLTCDTAIQIAGGELTPVATGNPCEYDVPEDDFKWYYIHAGSAENPTAISNTFTQSKTVTKSPWNCYWYPMSEEQSPNLYDADGCLDKYDTAYTSGARDRERENWYFDDGHYIAQNTVEEDDAERTWGYDIDNADEDNDVWTGWDADCEYDFWHAANNTWGEDDDYSSALDTSWWGHCDMATAAVICEDEPTGNYNAPNEVVFTSSDKKGLLVALYHGFTLSEWTAPDPLPDEWHSKLEEWIIGDDSMFGCDVYNSTEDDEVWNYPIYAIDSATYEQKSGQSDEKVVEVTCEVKYWSGSAQTLYYRYNVTYDASGEASTSTQDDWQDHPSAPANKKRPDAVFMPNRQTSVGAYWQGQLDYDTIATIIPLD